MVRTHPLIQASPAGANPCAANQGRRPEPSAHKLVAERDSQRVYTEDVLGDAVDDAVAVEQWRRVKKKAIRNVSSSVSGDDRLFTEFPGSIEAVYSSSGGSIGSVGGSVPVPFTSFPLFHLGISLILPNGSIFLGRFARTATQLDHNVQVFHACVRERGGSFPVTPVSCRR